MNKAEISGTFTKDPVVRYAQSGTAWASFTLNVPTDNGKGRSYITCKAFNEIAKDIERIAKQGMYVEIKGHIQTGSYEGRNGKVYTTDVIADEIDFSKGVEPGKDDVQATIPQGFTPTDEDIPF